MKLRILSIGNKMPAWVETGYHEYAKRLPREWLPQLVELPLAIRSKSQRPDSAMRQEGRQLLAALSKGARVVVLDVKGRKLSTEKLAASLRDWSLDGRDIDIVIGGPDGISEECKAKADTSWSLSDLTLPHPLVRVVLIEQIYRAWSINHHHPYHR